MDSGTWVGEQRSGPALSIEGSPIVRLLADTISFENDVSITGNVVFDNPGDACNAP